jgi:hypothetical protein
MSITSKLTAAVAAIALVAGVSIATTPAHAGKWGNGFAVGLVGGAAVAGAVIAGSTYNAYAGPVYVGGYRRCGWVRQFDVYGDYVGTVRVCNYY